MAAAVAAAESRVPDKAAAAEVAPPGAAGPPATFGVLTRSKDPDHRHFRIVCEMLGTHRGRVLGHEPALCKDGETRSVPRYDWSEGGFPGAVRDAITRRITKDSVVTLTDLNRQAGGTADIDRLMRAKAIEEVVWVQEPGDEGEWIRVSRRYDLWVPRNAMESNRVMQTLNDPPR